MDQNIAPAPAPAAPVEAPAPAPAPETVSASVAAAEKNDFSAFQEAEVAKRRGTPKPAVEAAAPAAPAKPETPSEQAPAAPPAQPTLSKRQQEQNERTRRAVEQATADLRRQLTEAQVALTRTGQPAPPPQAHQPTAQPSAPDWRRYLALPNAPKFDDVGPDNKPLYATIDEHQAALSLFVTQQFNQEQAQSAQQRAHDAQRQRFLQDRGAKFHEKLAAAADADPDFLDKVHPASASARPLSGCIDRGGVLVDPGTGQPATFANVAAEAAFRSDRPDVLLKHLHAHPDETVAIASLPQSEWLPRLIHLDGRLSGASSPAAPAAPAQASAPPSSPISAAPPPPPQLQRAGSAPDPKQAALERGDFAAMQTLWSTEKRGRKATA